MPIAVVTGVTGQDGSYLAEHLLGLGYTVHGIVRRSSGTSTARVRHLLSADRAQCLQLHEADLEDSTTLRRLLARLAPDELYHLAGQSDVRLSFEIPESTCAFNAMGMLRVLEVVRDLDTAPRLFHATSSEIFGRPMQTPQTETTPFAPVNPYGVAKAFATTMVRVYRESFGLYAVNGILYNHESPRRGEDFVTRKICRAVAEITAGQRQTVALGDLSARRDWGHARDYVVGMWQSLQVDQADDYVFATGVQHSVADVLEVAFGHVGLDWRAHVVQNPDMVRRSDDRVLVGDASHAARVLGWRPTTGFAALIREMVDSERAGLGPLRRRRPRTRFQRRAV